MIGSLVQVSSLDSVLSFATLTISFLSAPISQSPAYPLANNGLLAPGVSRDTPPSWQVPPFNHRVRNLETHQKRRPGVARVTRWVPDGLDSILQRARFPILVISND